MLLFIFLFLLSTGFCDQPIRLNSLKASANFNNESCSDLLKSFAQSAADFTLCTITFARPVTLCEKCIDEYMKFHDKYYELINTTVNGTSCHSIYVSKDRLDAVLKFYNNILSIWSKGNCNDCFDWSGKYPTVSNSTKKFNIMFNETINCISSNINPNANNTDVVCEKCMQLYINLDEYYKSLSYDSIGVDIICMDVVDSMNATRSIWGKELDCCKLRETPEVVFLCCTVLISLLPLLFYLAVRYCGPIGDLPNELNQSRFKHRIFKTLQRTNEASQ